MKTNDYFLLTGTAAYSYLFYGQNAGINFLIFNLLIIFFLGYRAKQTVRDKKWLWAASMCLVTSISILMHSSGLAIVANCFSLLLLAAFSLNTKNSALLAFALSCYSVASSFVQMFIDAAMRSEPGANKNNSIYKYRMVYLLIVTLFCILFFALYRLSNPLFAKNTDWINLDFVNLQWFVFTWGGFLIVYGIIYQKSIGPIEKFENELSQNNSPANPTHLLKYETERFAGIALFIFLNVMLVILNAGDIQTIWMNGALPPGMRHTDFVHRGVEIIILSIVIAAGLIMFLYRRDFSSIKKSGALKMLIYLWIAQNLVMLLSTAKRNQMYIDTFSFTYMRIGVYAWLVLAGIGLAITFIKVMKERSNWFLISRNVAVWFCVLALSSLVNWDLYITRYNLNNKPLKDVDVNYLLSLSDANIPELISVMKEKSFPALNQKINDKLYTNDFVHHLSWKITDYLTSYKPSWQSWDLRDQRIGKSLKN
jgi:hypothetical protein